MRLTISCEVLRTSITATKREAVIVRPSGQVTPELWRLAGSQESIPTLTVAVATPDGMFVATYTAAVITKISADRLHITFAHYAWEMPTSKATA